ncbi:hypothetical protein Hamer_G002033 [Homarus americanus]|uniref:Uncharacterized protein n=1 Tax=Homarus americanus TaxID=6706 RepID=A0A8J5JRS3_HOMAM|nr:hypothetical protein Hamer_G002033 [Homarus americanus]
MAALDREFEETELLQDTCEGGAGGTRVRLRKADQGVEGREEAGRAVLVTARTRPRGEGTNPVELFKRDRGGIPIKRGWS